MNASRRSLVSPLQVLAICILVAAAALALGCSDDGIEGAEDGDLSVTPPTVDFGNVVIDTTSIEFLEVTNEGERSVRVSNLTLGEDETTPGTHDAFEIINPWDDEEGLLLQPEETHTLEIEYAPEAPEPYNALIEFDTSITTDPFVEVPVRATTPAPELLAPETLVFERTPAGSQEWRLIELENIGTADLLIDDIVLGGNNADQFDLSYPVPADEVEDETIDANAVVAPEEHDRDVHPDVIAPGESTWIRVYFEAEDEDFRSAEVILNSNLPQHRIAVAANSDAACLELVGVDTIDFGLAAIDDTTQRTVTLRNCSRLSETVVTDIELGTRGENDEFQPGGDIRFGIDDTSLPGDIAEGGSEILDPDETTSFLVTYSPLEETEDGDEAVLSVSSTDEASPLLADVTGHGSELECPIAEAEAQIAGSGLWNSERVFAVPLDVIEFDATDSWDPDGTELSYEWSLIQSPLNSTAQIQNPTSPQPTLTVDIAGPFVVELSVYDEAGIASCDPAEIAIDVEPESAIHVELTWEVPAASDGTGTDLDLHYLHPNGQWSEEPYGVYWANPDPDWEDGSDISLDIDDLYGEEPENINHDNPDHNYDYSTGVYYFGDGVGYGATDARVRIFFHDSLVVEKEQRLHHAGPTAGTGDFWYVADIGVTAPSTPDINKLDVIDELYENAGFPSN